MHVKTDETFGVVLLLSGNKIMRVILSSYEIWHFFQVLSFVYSTSKNDKMKLHYIIYNKNKLLKSSIHCLKYSSSNYKNMYI